MSILVFIEHDEGIVKKSSLEAVSYAAHLGDDVTAIALGNNVQTSELENTGKAGAKKVLHVAEEKFNQGVGFDGYPGRYSITQG